MGFSADFEKMEVISYRCVVLFLIYQIIIFLYYYLAMYVTPPKKNLNATPLNQSLYPLISYLFNIFI